MTALKVDVPAGFMRLEWRSDLTSDVHPLRHSAPEVESLPGADFLFDFTKYPTVDVNDPEAVLTVRTSPDADPTTVPWDTWHFTDETHVALDGGFQPFHWYELVYRTTLAPVAGCGMLAIRDVVSHLRADSMDHTFAYGVSQAGRLLRQFLSEGLNVDESGMTVFDGVFSDFASAARGEFNHRFAQPSVTQTNGFGTLAPSVLPTCLLGSASSAVCRRRSSPTAPPSTGTVTARSRTSTPTPAGTCSRTPTFGRT